MNRSIYYEWSEEAIKKELTNYNSKSDLRTNNQTLYIWLLKNNKELLYSVFPNRKPSRYDDTYTEEKIINDLKDFKNRKDLRENDTGYYVWLRKNHNDLLDKYHPNKIKREDVVNYLDKNIFKSSLDLFEKKPSYYHWLLRYDKDLFQLYFPKYKKRLTLDFAISELESGKYNTRMDLVNKNVSLYNWLLKNHLSLLNKYLPKIDSRWTDEKAEIELKKHKFKTRHELFEVNKTLYSWLYRNKKKTLLDTYIPIEAKYTDDELKKICSQYKNQEELRNNNGHIHYYLYSRKIMHKYYKNENPVSSKRCIYVCEFGDNYAYIGLTNNLKRRQKTHISKPSSAIFNKILKNKDIKYHFKQLTEYIDEKEAQLLEDFYINKYKNNGFNILNRTKAGSLGANSMIWNRELAIKEMKNHKTRQELKYNTSGLYDWLLKNDKDLLNKTYIKKRTYWNDELAIEVLENNTFTSREDLHKRFVGLHDWIYNNNKTHILDKYIPLIRTFWNDKLAEEKISELSKIYKTRKDFKNANQGLERWLGDNRRDLLYKYYPSLKTHWNEKLATEHLKNNKYINRRDLSSKMSGLYIWLKKQAPHILDKYVPPKVLSWNNEKIIKILENNTFKNKKEFYKKYGSAYNWLLKNNKGLLNEYIK